MTLNYVLGWILSCWCKSDPAIIAANESVPAEELSFVVLLYSQVCEYMLRDNWKEVSFVYFKAKN